MLRIGFKKPFFFSLTFGKVKEMNGLCSKVKGKQNRHYILIDIDRKDIDVSALYCFLRHRHAPFLVYPTKHGYHAVIYEERPFKEVLTFLRSFPNIDKAWVERGAKRGYWFLDMCSWVKPTENLIDYLANLKTTFMKAERLV